MRTALQKHDKVRLFSDCSESVLYREYTIDEIIGSGANCFVYNAHWLGNDAQSHHVRIKECFPARAKVSRLPDQCLIWEDAQERDLAIERFIRAYETNLRFQSTIEIGNAAAHIIDSALWGNATRYVIMDTDEGTVYNNIIDDDLNTMYKTLLSLTRLVKKYHDAGYLLLDIKPDNIFILPETRELIKFFDFDSVLRIESIQNSEVPISYSYDYAAPELCAGDRNRICAATDYFSIGVIAFKAIFGRFPSADDCSRFSDWDLSNSCLFDAIGPRAIRLTKEFLRRTLSASVTGRYRTASAMICALEALVDQTDITKVFLAGTRSYSTAYFIGRQAELQQIHDAFSSGCRSVFLSGMGGIGKTVLAKQYAEKYRACYDTVCFGRYSRDTAALLLDQDFLNIVHAEPFTTPEACVRQLRAIVDDHTLLIVDNYEISDSDTLFVSLLELNCKIIITTRSDLTQQFADTTTSRHISISALQKAECWQLFCQYYPKADYLSERVVIEQIFDMVEYHTLFITLLAKNFSASGYTPTEVLRSFSSKGVVGISEGRIRHQKDQSSLATLAGHMENLFSMSRLSDNAKYALACLSLLGDIRINKREMQSVCDCCMDTINLELIERGWLQYDAILDEVSMHSLIASTITGVLHPSLEECVSLKNYADRVLFDLRFTDMDSWNGLILNTQEQADFDNRVAFLLNLFKHLSMEDHINLEYIATSLFDLCVSITIGSDSIDVGILYDNVFAERIAESLSNGTVPCMTAFMGYGYAAFVWTESLRYIYRKDHDARHTMGLHKAVEYYRMSLEALEHASITDKARKQHAMDLLWPAVAFFSQNSSYFNTDGELCYCDEVTEYLREKFSTFGLAELLDEEQTEVLEEFLHKATRMFLEEREKLDGEFWTNIERNFENQRASDPGSNGDPTDYYLDLLQRNDGCSDTVRPIVETIISDSRLDRKGKYRIIRGNTLSIMFFPRLYVQSFFVAQYHSAVFLNGVIWISELELNLLPNESDDGWVWDGYTIGDALGYIHASLQLAAAHILLGNREQALKYIEETRREVDYALQHGALSKYAKDYHSEQMIEMYENFLFTMYALGCGESIIGYLRDFIEQCERYGTATYHLYDLALHCAQELHDKQLESKYRLKMAQIAETSFRYE